MNSMPESIYAVWANNNAAMEEIADSEQCPSYVTVFFVYPEYTHFSCCAFGIHSFPEYTHFSHTYLGYTGNQSVGIHSPDS